MSQSGYTPILIYASGTASAVPLAANMTSSSAGAELALNYADGKLYFKNSSGVVTLLAQAGSSGVTTFSAGTTGLTPNTATSGAVTLAGTLATTNGGTGLGSFTSGGAVYATSTSALTTGTLPVASGGTGAASLTANNVLLGNGTSAPQFVAPGTSGNVLTSNGTTWTSAAAAGGFGAGTLMLFQQTAAPTGWTKQTTHDNKALRVVSGTASSGGTTAFTTVFTNQTPTITTSGLSAGATTLTTAQMPAHTHSQTVSPSGGNDGYSSCGGIYNFNGGTTGSQGSGGSHTHSISGSATSSAVTLNVQYVDLIIASKN